MTSGDPDVLRLAVVAAGTLQLPSCEAILHISCSGSLALTLLGAHHSITGPESALARTTLLRPKRPQHVAL